MCRVKVAFHGAARTVTGSKHLLRVNGRSVLLDCGLFQGRRDESEERNRNLPFRVDSIDAVILSHAHIDHSGNLPTLAKLGFRGSVHATAATVDLCRAMLPDSAHIQEKDAEFVNKHPSRHRGTPRQPLYTSEDVERLLPLFREHPYGRPVPVCEGLTVTFHDAGHILGSSFLEIDMEERGARRKLVFSGDLGRRHLPILRDPEPRPPCDVLLVESTYGGRTHPPVDTLPETLGETVNRVLARGGKILVPAFAVGRVQEIVWILKQLIGAGTIPRLPIYVDSPLAVDVTEIFSRHEECYDAETSEILGRDGDPFGFRLIRYIQDVEQSKALNGREGTAIIISPSGMCEAGRILHHLRNNIGDPRNLILIVGFQAEDTLGKRLVEKREQVRIFGEEFDRRAEVAVMNGFSAHADHEDLLSWIDSGPRPGRTFIVHGNDEGTAALSKALGDRGFGGVEIPVLGQEFPL
jgi:metallo-beta-lactamase family protein